MITPPVNMPRKAMILAAGLGLRMRPVTNHIPKPMVEVAGRSLIHRTLDQLARSGVEHVVVNTSYKAQMLEESLASRNDIRIDFSREETPLETGGGILKALPMLGGGAFFVLNSDVICLDGDMPALHRLANRWDESKMDALLLAHVTNDAIGYPGRGDFWIGEEGEVRRRLDHEDAPYVFTGVQILHPRLFADAPTGPFSINLLYNRYVGEGGWLSRVYTLPHDGEWLHVGDPEGLAAAENFLKTHL